MHLENKIMVIGGGGYVGSALVPSLMEKGYNVSVFDTFWYGDNLPGSATKILGDIRDRKLLINSCKGMDKIIHLACISNDPSFDLNPALGKSINLDAFPNIVDSVKENGIKRFIFASSSSIYGIKEEERVTEEASAEPMTDYAKYKWECEEILKKEKDFEWTIIRPATVCGYAPRLRLDLVVNILTANALEKGKIKILGGKQFRPNINVKDMVRAYEFLLEAPSESINGEAFNAGDRNYTVEELAGIVNKVVPGAELEFVPTNDNRSYRIDSEKIKKELNFEPIFGIEEAVRGIVDAYKQGKIINALGNPMYHNIKRMKELDIK
jgi:nucleoside-diphosphate-sugar epimerase